MNSGHLDYTFSYTYDSNEPFGANDSQLCVGPTDCVFGHTAGLIANSTIGQYSISFVPSITINTNGLDAILPYTATFTPDSPISLIYEIKDPCKEVDSAFTFSSKTSLDANYQVTSDETLSLLTSFNFLFTPSGVTYDFL